MRWWMTGPRCEGADVKVWLECQECETKSFKTGNIWVLHEHMRDNHPTDVLTIQSVRNQTMIWLNDWILKTTPPPFTYGMIRRSLTLYPRGITA